MKKRIATINVESLEPSEGEDDANQKVAFDVSIQQISDVSEQLPQMPKPKRFA